MHVHVENVGGIEETELTIEPGTTLITGENASNKTSLLHAILFAIGRDEVPIRTGAEQARVELSVEGETVVREATRTAGGVSVSGEPLISDSDDRDLFERFAALLETNPLRTAVQTTDTFAELLKEPMDIDTLEAERTRKLDRKRTLQAELDELAGVDDEIGAVEAELAETDEEVGELEDELDELYEQLPEQDDDLAELRERRTELVTSRDRLDAQIDDVESAVDRLESKITELEEKREDLDEEADAESLRRRRTELREQLDAIDERVDVLQTALTANRELLDADMREVFDYESGLDEDRVECWACGQEAPVSSFESAVDRLRELVEAETQRRREYEPELDAVEEELADIEERERERERLAEQLQSARAKHDSRVQSLEQKREQLAETEDELEDVEAQLDDAKQARTDDHSEVSKAIEETRVALETKRRERERLNERRSTLADRRTERDRKQERLAELDEEIRELTSRIENLEADLRETFNDAIDDLLAVLDFEEIERMWLDGNFELVVAREVEGAVREDTVENLAESERGMIGLVLGLAGYLSYDVDTVSPVLVVDSLGAFDAERADRLLAYFGEHVEYLVAAVHPEQVAEAEAGQTTPAPGR